MPHIICDILYVTYIMYIQEHTRQQAQNILQVRRHLVQLHQNILRQVLRTVRRVQVTALQVLPTLQHHLHILPHHQVTHQRLQVTPQLVHPIVRRLRHTVQPHQVILRPVRLTVLPVQATAQPVRHTVLHHHRIRLVHNPQKKKPTRPLLLVILRLVLHTLQLHQLTHLRRRRTVQRVRLILHQVQQLEPVHHHIGILKLDHHMYFITPT